MLDVKRAREFVTAYCENGGPVPTREVELLVGFMRWWIREDARVSFTECPGSSNTYAWIQVRAFAGLRDVRLGL